MQDGQIDRTVSVLGQPYTVSVHQGTKTVWIAIGAYNGQRIEEKGGSMRSAVNSWIKTAAYWGNL